MTATINGEPDVRTLVGKELPPSSWLTVDQTRIDAFAACTGDDQWIHTDPVRAAHGPYGTTVAHGFLTLSLLPALRAEVLQIEGFRAAINYGMNRVRLPAPLPAGSRVRAHFTIIDVQDVDGSLQLELRATVEREHESRPVCVADLLVRLYF